ncbi:adenine phosphoribosyltransferase [Marssonina coronariae]|uniref:adenine phosphoribosyltransferase n=1 Tax=Diplocarpon coronariae TaxID=2795749 RepID=A0A218Z5G1_9HELO|nr:adenine phosphoribosyltransferase [Marssonina coronariae]
MADAALVLSKIKIYTDHPIPGQPFADIFPIFRDPVATEAVVQHLADHIKALHDTSELSSLVCVESRGFFFGPIIASRLGLPCVPIRKQGKLPEEKIRASYDKEYGSDVLELKSDAFEGIDGKKKVLLIDDLLGKGGTILAAKGLVERMGMEVAECLFIFDIPQYYGEIQEKLGKLPRYAMIQLR